MTGPAPNRPEDAPAYVPAWPAREEVLQIRRQLQLHLWRWPLPEAQAPQEGPLLVMLHGWMDLGASFQFLVDALLAGGPLPWRGLLAWDARGFGGSRAAPTDSYVFADYLGDLDALLDRLSPDAPVDLLGHSMGGNIAMSYAGVRPQRVRRLINVEGFGMPAADPDAAPGRLARWLDQLREPETLSTYAGLDAVVSRLRRNNPRLRADRARWLATQWAAPAADGRWHLRADPAHKHLNPVPYRLDETLAAWRRITAPTLWVEGAQTDLRQFWGGRDPRDEIDARLAVLPRVERVRIEDCAHMVHHDQPDALAAALLGWMGTSVA